jgi:hypothetical protein
VDSSEATADPAFVLITSVWYTRQQQPTIIGYWYSANGIGIAVGGLLGYGIGNVRLLNFLFSGERLSPVTDQKFLTFMEIRIFGKKINGFLLNIYLELLPRYKIIGALCSGWAVVLWFVVPDSPSHNRWFNRRESVIIVSRKRHDQAGTEKRQYVVRNPNVDHMLTGIYCTGSMGNRPWRHSKT